MKNLRNCLSIHPDYVEFQQRQLGILSHGCNFDFNCETFNLPELPTDDYLAIVDCDPARNLQIVEWAS